MTWSVRLHLRDGRVIGIRSLAPTVEDALKTAREILGICARGVAGDMARFTTTTTVDEAVIDCGVVEIPCPELWYATAVVAASEAP